MIVKLFAKHPRIFRSLIFWTGKKVVKIEEAAGSLEILFSLDFYIEFYIPMIFNSVQLNGLDSSNNY